MTIKIFPSSLDFSSGALNLADYSSSCWRYIQLAQGLKTPFNPIYQVVGALHEDWHSDTNLKGLDYEKEKPFRFELNGATVSGRADYVLKSTVINLSVDECKSTFSTSTFKNSPKRQHLAQLALYLGHFQVQQGRLVYGHYQKHGEGYRLSNHSIIGVTIKDSGVIFVEKRDTGFKVDDVFTSAARLAEYLKSGELPPRPHSESFIDACSYCPLKAGCDKYDAGKIDEAALRAEAVTAIKFMKPSEAKITTYKEPKDVGTRKKRPVDAGF